MSRIPDVAEIAGDVERIERELKLLMPRELFHAEIRSMQKDIESVAAKVDQVAKDVAWIKERGEANRRLVISGVIFPVLVIIIGGILAAGMVSP